MAYSDDQAEIDSMMSSPMANMNGSISTSELNANISGLRSSINALSQQVVSLSKSTANVASQYAKHVNREYGIDGKAMGQSIAGAIAGPLGVVFAKTFSESGVGERIGAGIKGSIGSLVSKLKGNKPDYQSGFLDPSSMSKISNQNTRMLTDSIGNDINKPLVEANRIAQLELNETRKGNSDITSAVRNVSSTISDTSENYTESIISALENLGSKFEDSQAKGPENPFFGFAKSIFWSSKVGTLFKGKYTSDITRSKNPLETQVSALLQIYRWQRLYGELTKNQFNEIIRLMGGQEKDVVGKHGLLKDFWLRNKNSIKKKMGNGFQTKLIDFFMFDEEDRDDRNRAAMAAGLGQVLSGKRNKLFTWDSLKPFGGGDDKESALGYANGLDTFLMSNQQLQRASNELSSRFDRYQKVGEYGEWLRPDIDYKSTKESNDKLREQIQKLKDKPAKRDNLYNPLNWFESRDSRTIKNTKKRTELESQLKESAEKEKELLQKSQKFYKGVDPELYDSYGNSPKAKGINISHTYNSSGSTFKPIVPNPLYNPSLEGVVPETVPVTIMGNVAVGGDDKTSATIVAKAKQMATMDIAKKDPESVKISLPAVDDPQTALLQTVAKNTAITAAASSKSAKYQEKIFEDDQEDESEEARNRRWQREWDKKQREKESKSDDGEGKGDILSKLNGVLRTFENTGKFLAPIVGAVGAAWGGYKLSKFLNPFQNDENVKDITKNNFALNGSVLGSKFGVKAGEYTQKGINKLLTKIPFRKNAPGIGKLGKFGRLLGKGVGGGLNVVNTGMHVADGASRVLDGQSVRGVNQMAGGVLNWVPGGGLVTSMYGDLATEVGDSVQGKIGDTSAKVKLNDGTVLQTSNTANRAGDRATLMAQQLGTKAIPAGMNLTAKALTQLGTKTTSKLITQAGTKVAAMAGGKLVTKALPGIGTALSAVDAASRFKDGDIAGGMVAGLAGAAVFIPPPGVGFAVSMGLSGVLILHDIQRGILNMKKAAAVEDAMRDARFFMDQDIAQKIQQINNSDLNDEQKIDSIAKLYNNWKRDKGRPDYAKEIALMGKNKLFLKDKNTNIAFKKIDELAKKAGLNKQTAFGFKIGYYDSWKKDQVTKIGLEKVKHVVNDRALKDKNFLNNNKEEIDVLAKALKRGKIDLLSYYGDLYFMYYAYARTGSISNVDEKHRDYYSQMLDYYNNNAQGSNQEAPITQKAEEATKSKPKYNPKALEYYGKERIDKEPWLNSVEVPGNYKSEQAAKSKYENSKKAKENGSHIRIAGQPVSKDKPLTPEQLVAIQVATASGNTYEPWIMEKYNKQIKNNSNVNKSEGSNQEVPITQKAEEVKNETMINSDGDPVSQRVIDYYGKETLEKKPWLKDVDFPGDGDDERDAYKHYMMKNGKSTIKVIEDGSNAQNKEDIKKNQQLEATNKVYTQSKAMEATNKAVKDGTDKTVAAGNVNAAKISNSVNNVTNVINNNNGGNSDNDNPTLYQPNIASNVMNV